MFGNHQIESDSDNSKFLIDHSTFPMLSQWCLRQILVGSRVSLADHTPAPSWAVEPFLPPAWPGPVHSRCDRLSAASLARSVRDSRLRAILPVGAHAPSACGQAADRPNAQRKPYRQDIATMSAVELRLVLAGETPPSPRAIVRSATSCDHCGSERALQVGATDRERTTFCL